MLWTLLWLHRTQQSRPAQATWPSTYSHFEKDISLCAWHNTSHIQCSATLWAEVDSELLRQRLHRWMRRFKTFGSSSHSLAWHRKHVGTREQSFQYLYRRITFENLTATSCGWEKRSSPALQKLTENVRLFWQFAFQDRCPKCRGHVKTRTSLTDEIHCCCKTERLDKEVLA